MFVHFNDKVVNAATISWVDYPDISETGYVRVHYLDGRTELVYDQQAIDILMELDPSAIEGERLEHARYTWSIHNIIGHPLMQICTWLHLTRLGIKIHDITVPDPITKPIR